MRWDVVVIGAGAAGMMCAGIAGQRGRKVLVLEAAKAPGEKIRISGGGRCNFTNLHASPAQFLSANPHFCISALSRYTQQDFIALVARHRIGWHEKTLGQLFCDGSAGQIIDMLLDEMRRGGRSAAAEGPGAVCGKNQRRIHRAAGKRRCAGMRRAGGGHGRQVHSQDGRDRFRVPAGGAVWCAGDGYAAGTGAADL